jgi:hypothetical protein
MGSDRDRDDDRSDAFSGRFSESGDDAEGTDRPDELVEALSGADVEEASASGHADEAGDTATAADEEAASEAESFGFRVGVVVAAIAVGALFVGPFRLFDVVLGSGGLVPLETRDSITNEPFMVTGLSTLVIGLGAGFAFPLTDRRASRDGGRTVAGLALPSTDDYRSEMAIGLVLPAMGAFALLAVLGLLVPVGESLVAGRIVEATITLIVLAVVAAIALRAWFVILALVALASVYFVVPSFIGVFLGAFVGELVAGPPDPPRDDAAATPGD